MDSALYSTILSEVLLVSRMKTVVENGTTRPARRGAMAKHDTGVPNRRSVADSGAQSLRMSTQPVRFVQRQTPIA
jgi:hypothetical protein